MQWEFFHSEQDDQAQQQQLILCDYINECRLHLCNSSPHTTLSLQRLLATKYSLQASDLTPMWLLRVPETENLFRGSNFESYEDVRTTLTRVLPGLSKNYLLAHFQARQRRLDLCSTTRPHKRDEINGSYVLVYTIQLLNTINNKLRLLGQTNVNLKIFWPQIRNRSTRIGFYKIKCFIPWNVDSSSVKFSDFMAR
jgi:hypothetical protein